jgi:large subunit ribosomal protein L6
MSRVAKKPIPVPKGVQVNVVGQMVSVKGPKQTLEVKISDLVNVQQADGQLTVTVRDEHPQAGAFAGTARALISNMVVGVAEGFTRKLELVGVGYRASVQGKNLNLTLGFSHPVAFPIPEGITIETPSQTEILIKGANKQQVGQVAAVIRGYRPPEPYNGKGVKYSDEVIVRKEAKKK